LTLSKRTVDSKSEYSNIDYSGSVPEMEDSFDPARTQAMTNGGHKTPVKNVSNATLRKTNAVKGEEPTGEKKPQAPGK